MTSNPELQEEISRLKDELEEARAERDRLLDEHEDILNQHEEEFDTRKLALEKDTQRKIEEARSPLETLVQNLRKELELMHRASSGDPCGWREYVEIDDDGKEKPTFVNDETGERRKDMPPIYDLALKSKKIEQAQTDRDSLLKSKQKLKESESARRKLEVTCNELKTLTSTLQRKVKAWGKSSSDVYRCFQGFVNNFNIVINNVNKGYRHLVTIKQSLEKKNGELIYALCHFKTLNELVKRQQSTLKKNDTIMKKIRHDENKSNEIINILQGELENKISEAIEPINTELETLKFHYNEEKLHYENEKAYLATLWPPNWLLPTILLSYIKNPTERSTSFRKEAIQNEKKTYFKQLNTSESTSENTPEIFFSDNESKVENNEEHHLEHQSGRSSRLEQSYNGAFNLDTLDQWILMDNGEQQYFENSKTGKKCWFNPCEKDKEKLKFEYAKKHAAWAALIVIIYMRGQKRKIGYREEDALPYDIFSVEELAMGRENCNRNEFMSTHLAHESTQSASLVGKGKDKEMSSSTLCEKIKFASKKENGLITKLHNVRAELAMLSKILLSKGSFDKKLVTMLESSCNANKKKSDKCSIEEALQNKNSFHGQLEQLCHTPVKSHTSEVEKKSEFENMTNPSPQLDNPNFDASLTVRIDVISILVEEAVLAGFKNIPIQKPPLPLNVAEFEKLIFDCFFLPKKSIRIQEKNEFGLPQKKEIRNHHDKNVKNNFHKEDKIKDHTIHSEKPSQQNTHIELNNLVDYIMASNDSEGSLDTFESQYEKNISDDASSWTNSNTLNIKLMNRNDLKKGMDKDIAKANLSIPKVSKEASIYESVFSQISLQNKDVKQHIRYDHECFRNGLEDSLMQANFDIKEITKKISFTQNKIASFNGKLNGLNIEPKKPLPPGELPPLKLLSIPSDQMNMQSEKNTLTSDSEFEELVETIKLNKKNESTTFSKFNHISLTQSQQSKLLGIIEELNSSLKDEHAVTHRKMEADYERKKAAYEKQMIERKKEQAKVKAELWTNHVTYVFSREMKKKCEERHTWYQLELIDEDIKQKDLIRNQDIENIDLMKQLQLKEKIVRTIINQKSQLYGILRKIKWLSECQISSISHIDEVQLKQRQKEVLKYHGNELRNLNRALFNEGRRLKKLYTYQIERAKTSLCQLRKEKDLGKERKNLISLIETLISGEALSREILYKNVMSEDPVHYIEKTKLFAMQNLEDIIWLGCDSIAAKLALDNERNKLKCSLKSRKLARRREFYSRKLKVQTENTSEKQTLTQIENDRLKAINQDMNKAIKRGIEALRYQMITGKRKVDSLKSKVNFLICEIKSCERNRDEDLKIIRKNVNESIHILKKRIQEARFDLKSTRKIFKEKVTELYKSRKNIQQKLEGDIESAERRNQDLSSTLNAIRYDLSMLNVKEDSTKMKLKKMKAMWSDRVGTIKEQLKNEQRHSARLELVIAALNAVIKNYKENTLGFEQKLQRQQKKYEEKIRNCRYENWKRSVAMQILGTDIDEIFLFFLQRLSNLAGSSVEHNNKLREYGAIPLLTLFCKCPRQNLRILALQALGRMGWNDKVEKRILCWDVIQQWNILEEKVEEKRFAESIDDNVTHDMRNNTNTSRNQFRRRRQWALRRKRRIESPNEMNQLKIGSDRVLLSALFEMCMSNEIEKKHAVFALSIVSCHRKNAKHFELIRNCTSSLTHMLGSDDDVIRSWVCVIVGNLSLSSSHLRDEFLAAGCFETFMKLCKEAKNTNIMASSSAAMASLMSIPVKGMPMQKQCTIASDLMNLISSEKAINLIDRDEFSATEANIVECLAYLSTSHSNIIDKLYEYGLKHIILLFGSDNIRVREKTALLIGNIATKSYYRDKIGHEGGVEALFLLSDHNKEESQKLAFWALSNLAWDPNNQIRISKFYEQIIAACKSSFQSVQINAICCLANIVYYNEKNCIRLSKDHGTSTLVYSLCSDDIHKLIQLSALRIILSLSYTINEFCESQLESLIPKILKQCLSSEPKIQKFAAMILLNLSVRNDFKVAMVNKGAIVVLHCVQSAGDKISSDIVKLVLDELSEVCSKDNILKRTLTLGATGLIHLCKSEDVSIKKFAYDALAEEIWMNPDKQNELIELGVIDIVFTECINMSSDTMMLISALWFLRNLSYNNEKNKDLLGKKGVKILIEICKRLVKLGDNHAHGLEAALTALVNLVIDHKSNSLELLSIGRKFLEEISSAQIKKNIGEEDKSNEWESTYQSNKVLAKALLQIIQPHQKYVCQNCSSEQLLGHTCEDCGHQLTLYTCERLASGMKSLI